MGVPTTKLCVLLLLVAVCVIRTSAVSRNFTEEFTDGSMYTTLFNRFGYGVGGKLQGSVTVKPEGQRVYLALFPTDSWDLWRTQVQSLGSVYQPRLCLFPSAMRIEVEGTATFDHTVQYRDQYTLVALDCRGSGTSVEGNLVYTNPVEGSDKQVHLALEYILYPTVVSGLMGVYAVLSLAWIAHCSFSSARPERVHLVAGVAVCFKVVELAITMWYYSVFSANGVQGSLLYSVKQLGETASDSLFLLTLLLVALGWTITRHYLAIRERQVIAGVFFVFVVIGVMKAFCNDSDQLCGAYILTQYVVRSLIMLGIIVAMNFNITHLRASIHEGPWAPSLPTSYHHLRQLSSYRWAFLSYLLLPTLLLIVKITVLSWRFEWVSNLLQDLLLLYVFVHVGVTFRPKPKVSFTDISRAHQAAVELRERECDVDGHTAVLDSLE